MKKHVFYGVVLFITVVLPILGMVNCNGWNEGSMKASACLIENPFLVSYASFYYGWIFLSIFTLGAPLLIYGGAIFFCSRWIAKKFFK